MPRAQKPQATPPGANRTDLLTPETPGVQAPGQPNGQQPTQPIQVPGGLPYGEGQQLQQAQQASPLPAPAAQGTSMGLAEAARSMQMSGRSLSRKSERPTEPIMTGTPGNPTPQSPRQTGTLSSMLAAIAGASNNPALAELGQRAASAGQ